jgi:hypothetical protein
LVEADRRPTSLTQDAPLTTQYGVGEAPISAGKGLWRRYAAREACAQSCWPCTATAALLRWQCRQASPTLAGSASHALLAQLCADGAAAIASDAYCALVQQDCVAGSAAPHSGACRALLSQHSLGSTAARRQVLAGHIDLRSSGIHTSSTAELLHRQICRGRAPPMAVLVQAQQPHACARRPSHAKNDTAKE